ncbi:hypothetical protein L0222_13175 [bacterium]|nr:hypothetical protein [bacterium]MCI0601640.1 hypothetical protein [bacterium]
MDKDDLQRALKGEMDLEEFRDHTLELIYNKNSKGLAELCESQILTPDLFVEKVITEISPGNH